MNREVLDLAIIFDDDVDGALGAGERSKGELDHGWAAIVSASEAFINWWHMRTFKDEWSYNAEVVPGAVFKVLWRESRVT